MPPWPAGAAAEDFCYVTTRGRRTGRPHEIEIWFALEGVTLYILSGLGTDWVRNLRADPRVQVRIRSEQRSGTARLVEDPAEHRRARRALAAKYQGWREGEPMSEWASTATPVAIA